MSDNPYAPPSSWPEDEISHGDLIKELKSQSTWRLLGLGIITYGVYYAHYCARQSTIINRHVGPGSPIPPGLNTALFVFSYGSLALLIGYMFVDEDHPVALASSLADAIWGLLVLVWSFYGRNRVNALAAFSAGDARWFHGIWTFLFSILYFNYKINTLNKASSASGMLG